MRVAVVTPTIGAKTLSQCVESVQNQTYSDLTHYIFMDGKEHENKIWHQLEGATKVKTIRLEENIGKGWYGHRVYAACAPLVNADIICYLDEDNWFEPTHVEKLVEQIKRGKSWAFSLRKIYNKSGEFLCADNCESLGKWPVYFNNDVYHIDTSSFAVRKDVAIQMGPAWYAQWGADRQFFGAMKQYHPNFGCTGEHTLCYRLDGNEKSVTEEFFVKGNAETKKKYGDNYPWHQPDRESIEVGPGITILA